MQNLNGKAEYKHFAVKIMNWLDDDSSGTVELDPSNPANIDLPRYLKMEVVLQSVVGDMEAHIPRVIEVYAHEPNVIVVMDLLGYMHEEKLDSVKQIVPPVEDPDEEDVYDRYPNLNVCTGARFEGDHKPDELLKASGPSFRSLGETVEAQMCMVFHGTLQAFHHIFDRGVSHLDFEGKNLLVDENFQVRCMR